MATIRVTCPQCKGSGPAPESFFGIKVKCPRCGAVYTVDDTVAERPQSMGLAAGAPEALADAPDVAAPAPKKGFSFPGFKKR